MKEEVIVSLIVSVLLIACAILYCKISFIWRDVMIERKERIKKDIIKLNEIYKS